MSAAVRMGAPMTVAAAVAVAMVERAGAEPDVPLVVWACVAGGWALVALLLDATKPPEPRGRHARRKT